MKNSHRFVIIMAGGIGSRFWPYSRAEKPKQFLDILGTGFSLLQITFKRFQTICPVENIYVVSNQMYHDLVAEQLPELEDDQILLEPFQRNTAPCIAYACYKIKQKDPGACIVVSPSDHAVFNESAFHHTVETGLELACQGNRLLTLGIKPSRPETQYGYIQYLIDENETLKKVKTFTEKPETELAEKFMESGDFVWNSGIFIWNLKAILEAFENHLPYIAEAFREREGDFFTDKEPDSIREAYSHCRNISIDYGIMEKADNVYVILSDFGWSDLGSWSSLHEHRDSDENNNVVDANAMVYDSKDCFIKGPSEKLIVAHGLEGYLIAECGNVLVICKKGEDQKIKEFLSDAKSKKGRQFV